MRKLLIPFALMAAGLAVAGCDPYYHAAPGPYPDPGSPGGYVPPPGARVAVLGCPIPGVEPGCLSVRTAEGALFDISAARVRPDPRSPFAVEVTGRASPAFGYCQQGSILEDVEVRPSAVRCVEGALQGRPRAY